MKLFRLNLCLIVLFSAMLFFSCSSDKNEPTQSQAANPTPTVPSDASAVLAAIKVRSNSPVPVPGMVDILIDVGSANFFSDAVGGKRVSVGDVKLNDFGLKNIGESYVNGTTDIMLGINSGQGNEWNVAGGNGFEAFSHSTAKRTPGVIRLSGIAEEVSLGGDIKVSIESIPANCDNIIWVISDGKNTATKEVKSNSVTFSSSDLSGIKASSNGLIQVAAYNSESKSFSGKKVFFINETVDTKMVKLN